MTHFLLVEEDFFYFKETYVFVTQREGERFFFEFEFSGICVRFFPEI
jgi:hypothetical protein